MPENYQTRENLSRKDAKAQSAAAFQRAFLCAFAPLRERFLSTPLLKRSPFLLLTGAILFSTALTSATQQTPDPAVLYVSVLSDKYFPVPGLTAESFSVTVDKTPQSILSLSDREVPASVGILIDRSASVHMGGSKNLAVLRQHLIQGIQRFAQLSHPENEYFVLGFADKTSMVQDWTREPFAAADKLSSLDFNGNTSLYDAINIAIPKVMSGRHAKHVLLVFSDGLDSASKTTFIKARDSLKRSDILLYAIGFETPASAGSALGVEGIAVLDELAAYGGGRVLLVNGASKTRTFVQALEVVALELRAQYQLSISGEEPVGKERWRKLRVRVTTTDASGKQKNLVVKTRQGYYR